MYQWAPLARQTQVQSNLSKVIFSLKLRVFHFPIPCAEPETLKIMFFPWEEVGYHVR
jgi:hypothetical protein